MKKKKFACIYGPVSSWRLGVSLGIDLFSFSKQKVCNFNCLYCQLGRSPVGIQTSGIYVKTSDIIKELKKLPRMKIDYITFSGGGEPGLAKNLGQTIRAVKRLNIAPIAILTNSVLINQEALRKNLFLADFVAAKLDAHSQQLLEEVNCPGKSIKFNNIIKGLKQFRKKFKGRFALQIMFLRQNQRYAGKIAQLAREINPDEVQINTPRRPSQAKPLSEAQVARIKKHFTGLNVISVYDRRRKQVAALDKQGMLKRRGAE